jgi:hypothetical protein
MKQYRSLAALVAAILVASCGDKNDAHNISAPTAGAAVKFFNYGVNAPGVNFYANDLKLSAISSTSCSDAVTGASTDPSCLTTGKESTTGTAYGAASGTGSGVYSSVAPGSYTLSGRIAATTDNGLAISSTPANFENGKFYSYYLSGIYNSTAKTVEGFVIEDPLPGIDLTKAYVRFVNVISNSQPMTLFAKDTVSGVEGPIGADVAYKGAGTFIVVPPSTYTLNARVSGSSTNLITAAGVSFTAGHVYTVAARGDMTATTGTNKPALTSAANR